MISASFVRLSLQGPSGRQPSAVTAPTRIAQTTVGDGARDQREIATMVLDNPHEKAPARLQSSPTVFLMTYRFRRSTSVVVLSTAALLAACGIDNAADDQDAVPTCDDSDVTVCVAGIVSLNNEAAVNLDRAVELDGGSPVELEAGVCGSGGDGLGELTWSLCRLTLDDGRQIVLGRSADADTTVRTTVAGEAIEFPLATAPGDATVLNSPTAAFVIVDADGNEIGSTEGA